MKINELKLDHGLDRAYRAPSIKEMEAEAEQKGSARFADLEVTYLQSYRRRAVYGYTVCGRQVTKEQAERAFA